MQTIEEQLVDKTAWPDGPWQDEYDKKQWLDKGTNLPCLVVRHAGSGHFCGYVGISKDHPYYDKGYDDIPAEVHGGLTYTNTCNELICHKVEEGEDDNVLWVGFDCAHSGDLRPNNQGSNPLSSIFSDMIEGPSYYETYRDVAYVEAEVTSLAEQLKALTCIKRYLASLGHL